MNRSMDWLIWNQVGLDEERRPKYRDLKTETVEKAHRFKGTMFALCIVWMCHVMIVCDDVCRSNMHGHSIWSLWTMYVWIYLNGLYDPLELECRCKIQRRDGL